MNRLVLIGNGFDLAHGLETSYKSFLFWYLEQALTVTNRESNFSDVLLKVTKRSQYAPLDSDEIKKLVGAHYKTEFKHLTSEEIKSANIFLMNPYQIVVNSILLKRLLSRCVPSNWVDIEVEYYSLVRHALKQNGAEKTAFINKLNNDLEHIIEQLHKYLDGVSNTNDISEYKEILFGDISPSDINDPFVPIWVKSTVHPYKDCKPQLTHILNFNYTNTVERYLHDDKSKYSLNYIHGKLKDDKNPLIFGFGDELDKNYPDLEDQQDRAFFRFVKSFWYLRTENYQNLMRFVESNDYHVVVLGHSCGLSDRTMLNQIFTHANCKGIKIHYHEYLKGSNNYTEITQEISRHFGKDKAAFRAKVISLPKSEVMPQYKVI